MTLRRLLERHVVTDRHLFALRDIARTFVSRDQMAAARNAFGEIYKPRPERKLKVLSVGKGGWVETVGLVNALLGGVFVGALAFWPFRKPVLSLIALIAASAAIWIEQRRYGYRMIKRSLQKARNYDCRQCGKTA
jgi:hypothetical protein